MTETCIFLERLESTDSNHTKTPGKKTLEKKTLFPRVKPFFPALLQDFLSSIGLFSCCRRAELNTWALLQSGHSADLSSWTWLVHSELQEHGAA